MVTLFVNQSGSDSNDGLTAGTAYLTLGKAAAQGGTNIINVQSAVYSEAVSTGSDTWLADGVAILDGENVIGVGFTATGTISVLGFEIKNFTTAGVSGGAATLEDCYIHDCPTAFASSIGDTTSKRTVFANCTIGVGVDTRRKKLESCTFVDCGTAIDIPLAAGGGADTTRVQNCIFKDNTIHIDSVNAGTYDISSNGNCFFPIGAGNKFVLVAADHTTLASWQTAVGGTKDSSSIELDPKFLDQAKRLYGLASDSPCLVSGLLSVADRVQGAYNRKIAGGDGIMDGLSVNLNQTVWNSASDSPSGTAVYTGVEQDGSGNIVLSSGFTTGTAEFTILYSPARKIGRNFFNQILQFPLGVLDDSTADSIPGRLGYEFAVDTGGGFGGFTSIEPGSHVGDPGTGFRDLSIGTALDGLKVLVTFRKDGLAQ